MTPQQKISVIALGVFAVAAITLGLLHLHQGIFESMVWYTPSNEIEQTDLEKDDKLADLASKDTDNDGLNDYEELHVFNTSPYLADTDGDKLDDAAEIQSGTDPNCPVGQDCGAGATEIVGAEGGAELYQFGTSEPYTPPEAMVFMPQGLEQLLTGEGVTPETVRNLLQQTGVDEQVLNGVDDASLMKLYGEVLKQLNANGALSGVNIGALGGAEGGAEGGMEGFSAEGEPASGWDASALEELDLNALAE